MFAPPRIAESAPVCHASRRDGRERSAWAVREPRRPAVPAALPVAAHHFLPCGVDTPRDSPEGQ